MKENLMDMQLKITELMANKSSLEQENLMLRQKIVELEKEVGRQCIGCVCATSNS